MKNVVFIALFFLFLLSCKNKCDYNKFYECYNIKFTQKHTKSSLIVYEELLFMKEFYIHVSRINDSVISDTNKYDYNINNGKITTYNFIHRFDRVTGETFINKESTIVFQFRCNGITLGDIYYRKHSP